MKNVGKKNKLGNIYNFGRRIPLDFRNVAYHLPHAAQGNYEDSPYSSVFCLVGNGKYDTRLIEMATTS